MAKASKATVQVKKKRWVTIVAPKLFNEMPLCESYLLEAKDAIGRTVRVSVMQITGEPQKQYVTAGFTITGLVGDKLTTSIKSYKILPSALRRLVRRNKDKFEDSLTVVCSDGMRARVKPFVVARHKARNSILTALRKGVREAVTAYALGVTGEQLFADTIAGKLQHSCHDSIKKTYPVGAFEIRWLLMLGMGPKPEVPVKVEAKEEPKVEQKEVAGEQEESAETVEVVDQAAEVAKEQQDSEDVAEAGAEQESA